MLTTDISPGTSEAYGPVRLYRPQDGADPVLFVDWCTRHTADEREACWHTALERASGLGYHLACEAPRSTIAGVEGYALTGE